MPKALRSFFRIGLIVLGGATFASIAAAGPGVTWTEMGDAGDLTSTAQVTAGLGLLTSISGVIETASDVDLYCIRITDRTLFRAWLICSQISDPDIWLFTTAGIGLSHNDGCTAAQTLVSGANVPVNGIYIVGVSVTDGIAEATGMQPIWNPPSQAGERAPDGTGAPGPLVSWGPQPRILLNLSYTIHLAGCEPCNDIVPVETTTWGRVRGLYR